MATDEYDTLPEFAAASKGGLISSDYV